MPREDVVAGRKYYRILLTVAEVLLCDEARFPCDIVVGGVCCSCLRVVGARNIVRTPATSPPQQTVTQN
jgi:hypothetical protein